MSVSVFKAARCFRTNGFVVFLVAIRGLSFLRSVVLLDAIKVFLVGLSWDCAEVVTDEVVECEWAEGCLSQLSLSV